MIFASSEVKIKIKKFPHNGDFKIERFYPFEELFHDFKAYLFSYTNNKPHALVIPNDMEIEITDSCPLSFEEIEIIDNFTITGNGGFQYQGKEKNGKDDFHFGINRVSKGKPFSKYHINIRLNTDSYNYFAESSYFSQYIFDDEEKLEEMQELFSQSNFVLNCADNLLYYLFGEIDSFENFKEIINLFSLVLGPNVVSFYPLDERDFYVQAEHLFINCPDCYITCYDKIQPIDVNAPIIVSADACKVMKLPPVDDGEPPPPPPANIDPLDYMIQNYPATPLTPAPPVEPGAIIEPMPNDDAWHTSLWVPCQGDVNLYNWESWWESDKVMRYAPKSDSSSYFCNDNNPNDNVLAYFYRVTLDNSSCVQSFGCLHEMFEVTPEGIFLRREVMGPDKYECKSQKFDYRHHDTFKWFPRYVSPPTLYVQWHDEVCWKTGGFSEINPCIGISESVDAPNIVNYPHPAEIPESKGGPIAISQDYIYMPDPNDSKSESYCVPPSLNGNCPSGTMRIGHIDTTNPEIGFLLCYNGPLKRVKTLVNTQWWQNAGTSVMNCGKEIYYYAKDLKDTSIAYGLVKWEFIPAEPDCTKPPTSWTEYMNMYFSTKYYPDLRPYIPLSADEKH